jgi:hypothetical protein
MCVAPFSWTTSLLAAAGLSTIASLAPFGSEPLLDDQFDSVCRHATGMIGCRVFDVEP